MGNDHPARGQQVIHPPHHHLLVAEMMERADEQNHIEGRWREGVIGKEVTGNVLEFAPLIPVRVFCRKLLGVPDAFRRYIDPEDGMPQAGELKGDESRSASHFQDPQRACGVVELQTVGDAFELFAHVEFH